MDEGRIRQAILEGLAAFDRAVDNRKSEQSIHRMVTDLNALVPHAGLSDLLFWGERERSHDEIADEAICREKLWLQEGELALLIHKEAQFRHAQNDPNLPLWAEQYIESELPLVVAKIAAFGGPQRH